MWILLLGAPATETPIMNTCRQEKLSTTKFMLQMNVQNIQHIKTYGFEDSLHDIMSTV